MQAGGEGFDPLRIHATGEWRNLVAALVLGTSVYMTCGFESRLAHVTARLGTAAKATGTVAKGTARSTSVGRVRGSLGICYFCGDHKVKAGFGGKCGPCREAYETFLVLVGNGHSTSESMFKMYQDLLARIASLEDALEIKRIKEKYS